MIKPLKIKFIIICISLLTMMVGCKPNKEENIYKLLQGDWVGINEPYFFCFKDSSFSAFNMGTFEHYFIKRDSMIGNGNLKIIKITDKTLWIERINNTGNEKPNLDTFVLKRNDLDPASNVIVTKIIYERGGFLENIIISYICEFNQNGDCYYRYHKKNLKGDYLVKLSEHEKVLFQNKIQNIKLGEINNKYVAIDMFPAYRKLQIEFHLKDQKKIKILTTEIIGDGYNFPPGLAILITYLDNIHTLFKSKKLELQHQFEIDKNPGRKVQRSFMFL